MKKKNKEKNNKIKEPKNKKTQNNTKQKKEKKNQKKEDSKSLKKKTKRENKKETFIKNNNEENACKIMDLNINMKTHNQNFEFIKTLIKEKIYDSIIFTSVNDIFYIVYIKYESNIIYCYNLIKGQLICEVKQAHSDNIKYIQYILDKKNKRDLIMTISLEKIKIWNINLECLTDIKKKNNDIYKICHISYIHNNNYIHIIESSDEVPILVYNLDGIKIKKIKNNEKIYTLKTFYDDKSSKSYIIVNNVSYLKSYDYDNDKEYTYYFHDTYNEVFQILINNKNDQTQLIGLGRNYPFIIIWNFHNGQKLYDIYLKGNVFSVLDTMNISYSFLWDEQYLCFGICNDIGKGHPGVYTLKLLDLKTLRVCGNLINLKNKRFSLIKKIEHPIYGECLITEIFFNEIGLWKKKEK